jgi:glucose uptake protein
LTIGVLTNYLQAPVGNSVFLFSGVGLIVLAILLNANAYRRMMKSTAGVSTKGLVLSVVSGCLMGLFYKYVAGAMYPDFNVPEPGKLGPYSAVFIFSIGIFLSNFLFNTLLMLRPFSGEPVSYAQYFKGSAKNHLLGVLGGSIWCLGMSFSIIASGKAGPAISYGLGQGATIVAAIWGIYIWKEFKQAPKGVENILRLMLFFYIAGLALIITAR